ncbi:ABC transporter substrate-binding protein [Mycobacterium sp. 236(2023)]|uniref:ABC transporter substrate-binding protein n=1 Tax=Mycobacterium sp. 236(2023) TaxID=3038163 RepID=UPI002414D60F|nr:ABC transporter substrate-binding protein [Mycobacterium sp. 236(2023)]MDG4667120.1 ABC transporter substrate-binding protein [Mycobacterium sp. 236(2023)]
MTKTITARGLRRATALAVVGLLAAACTPGTQDAEGKDANGVVRMSLAPDAIWEWLEDEGIKAEMEEASGIKILTSATWDEFGIYAGGHADVVSTGTWEVPNLDEATKVPSTVFGKYNEERAFLAVPTGSPDQTLCDLKGKKFVSFSTAAVTLMWSMYASEWCDGATINADSDDYDLVVTDIQNVGSLVARKDAAGGTVTADFAMAQLREGSIQPLYDSKSVAEIFADDFGDGHIGPWSNVFVAPTAWLDKNPDEAAFLLAVWERGLQEWKEHKAEIIARYPEHFGVTQEGDVEFLIDYFENVNDWYADSVYIDDTWIEGEKKVFDLMKKHNLMEQDAEVNFKVINAANPAENQ